MRQAVETGGGLGVHCHERETRRVAGGDLVDVVRLGRGARCEDRVEMGGGIGGGIGGGERHVASPPGELDGDGRGDRGFADPALAHGEHQPSTATRQLVDDVTERCHRGQENRWRWGLAGRGGGHESQQPGDGDQAPGNEPDLITGHPGEDEG
jgi:hypothetical protein